MTDTNIPSSFPPPGSPLPELPPLLVEEKPVEEASHVPLQPVSAPVSPTAKQIIIRANCSGDKVYLLEKGERHWITTPEKLSELGYTFADVIRVTDDELLFYKEGEPI